MKKKSYADEARNVNNLKGQIDTIRTKIEGGYCEVSVEMGDETSGWFSRKGMTPPDGPVET